MSQYCAKCGKELPEGAEFCPGCGSAANGVSGNGAKKYTGPTSWSWTYRIGFVRNAVSVELKDDHLEITEGEPKQIPLCAIQRVELKEHKLTALLVVLVLCAIGGVAAMAVTPGGGLGILVLCAACAYRNSYILHHFNVEIISEVEGREEKTYLNEMGSENLTQIKAALDQHMA